VDAGLRRLTRIAAAGALGSLLLGAPAACAWVPTVRDVSPGEAARQIQRAYGQVRVVMIYSTSCPHCRTMFPDFVDLAARYRSRGVTVLTFATDDDAQDVADFLGSKRLPFPTARVADAGPGDLRKAMRSAGLDLERHRGVPYVAVVDRDGTVVGETTGSGSTREVEDWLDEIGVAAP